MAGISRKPWITPQDYLDAERTAEVRHEYVDGEIFAMAGASRRHATIVGNLFVALRQAARTRGCQAYANDVKVRVEAANAYHYPDLVATCAGGDGDPCVVKDPVLVVEVLSDSTEAIDRREKRTNYQKIRPCARSCWSPKANVWWRCTAATAPVGPSTWCATVRSCWPRWT